MKIATPTNDGINISAHFGRCREFLIFEVQNGQVKLIETRINAGCHEHGSGSSDGGVQQHSHSGFVERLRDCDTVLCGGIGAGAVEPLRRRTHGEVFIVHAARLVDWGAGSVTREAIATCTYRARPGTFERIG